MHLLKNQFCPQSATVGLLAFLKRNRFDSSRSSVLAIFQQLFPPNVTCLTFSRMVIKHDIHFCGGTIYRELLSDVASTTLKHVCSPLHPLFLFPDLEIPDDHNRVRSHTCVFIVFAALIEVWAGPFLETGCVASVHTRSTRSTKKLTIDIPNYTFKANNVEFNPLTWLLNRCFTMLTAALPQSSCFQPQGYSKLVEITFCLAPPSIKPCLSSYLILTNNASACDVSGIHVLVDAWRIQIIFKLHPSSAPMIDTDWEWHWRMIWIMWK